MPRVTCTAELSQKQVSGQIVYHILYTTQAHAHGALLGMHLTRRRQRASAWAVVDSSTDHKVRMQIRRVEVVRTTIRSMPSRLTPRPVQMTLYDTNIVTILILVNFLTFLTMRIRRNESKCIHFAAVSVHRPWLNACNVSVTLKKINTNVD